MRYCAHLYGRFWKAQLSFSHKKQTRWSLVQYLSLIARKRAKTAFLSKIFSFCLGEHAWALFLLHHVHTGCQSVGSRSALYCAPGVGTDGHCRGQTRTRLRQDLDGAKELKTGVLTFLFQSNVCELFVSVFVSQGETGTGGSPSSLHGIVSTQLVQVWLSSSNSPRHLLLSKPSYLKFVLFLHFFFM